MFNAALTFASFYWFKVEEADSPLGAQRQQVLVRVFANKSRCY